MIKKARTYYVCQRRARLRSSTAFTPYCYHCGAMLVTYADIENHFNVTSREAKDLWSKAVYELDEARR